MEFDKIRGLIEQLTSLMEAKKLDELEIEVDDLKVAIRRSSRGGEPPAIVVAPHAAAGAPAAAPAPPGSEAGPQHAVSVEGQYVVHSPMVGTLYRSESPDADSYVEVGDEVGPDTVLCIIEAMKVMNELKAEVEGTIVSIEIENGEAVEFGQPLFIIALRKS